MTDKEKIIALFNENVKGKMADFSQSNSRHDGKSGHWLERMMGIQPNGNNAPDLMGYEMKNATTNKTTFGDWSANYYIFKDPQFGITRNDFFDIFGKPNEEKMGRPSWSGEPAPKIRTYNSFGQILIVDESNNIFAKYSFSKDTRANKSEVVPKKLQVDDLVLARWDAKSIKKKLEDKFDQMGWFKCLTNAHGVYTEIVFGAPMNFDIWIKLVQSGDVFFDSGMYKGNNRPYSQWRATNAFWDKLIISRH